MDSIAFAPHVSPPLLWTLIAVAALLTGYALFMRARGAWARALALLVLILAIANPLAVRQSREPLSDVVALVLDHS